MKRLFFRTFFTFVTALLILVAVMALASVLGFRRSLAEWSQARSLQIEAAALEILKRYPESISVRMPENTPLFVYDSKGDLIFTNRGQAGRGRGAAGASVGEELIPLRDNDSTVGYYRTGRMHFQDDAANSRFFESINRTIWLGLVLALLIALPFALFFSRSLSVPAARLARGLDRIAHGVLGVRIVERGAEEIALIARSANRLSDQLQHEKDIRRRWIQDITHDLRTPIAAMKAQFEGMRDGVLDLSAGRIEKNLLELSRIEILVGGLEELMRLESPEMKVKIEDIEALPFVERIKERFSYELKRRDISCECSVGIDRFQADPELLPRAVTNFFTNAIRHTPLGGRIQLSVESTGDGGTLFRLANTGDQIPQAELSKVFDRLYRGEYARSSPGSGLGLTIARAIAELHGGSVGIRNWEEGGVIVEMILKA